jgi:type IV pilus assembly protein PilO
MPRTQREQLLVIVGVLGLLAAAAYWYFAYNPKTAQLAAQEIRVDSIDRKNQIAKAEMAKGSANELRQQATTYAENLLLMRRLVPAANEIPELVDQISTAARRAGLDVSQFQPLGPEIGTDFDAYKYKLRVAGDFHSLAEFLANVGSLQRIVVPVNLVLTPAQPNPQGRTAIADFELHTYVAHTAAPPTAGGNGS